MKNFILLVMVVLASSVSAQSFKERLHSLKTFNIALNEGKIVSKTQKSTSSGTVTCQTCFGTGRTQMGFGNWVVCMACGGSGKWMNLTPSGGGVPIVPQGGYNSGNNNGTSTGNTSTGGSQRKNHKCITCNGTGREIRNDAASPNGLTSKYCSECGSNVSASHYHAPCRACKGKGNW